MRGPLRTLIHGARPPRIFYTMLERRSISTETARAISKLEGVWVPCRANVEAFSRSGVPAQKIGYMPFPFFNDDPYLGLFGFNRAPGVPRLFWIGRWEPRKAPDNLVRAFLRAFAPGKAKLTIKIGPTPMNAPNFPLGPDVVAVDEIYTNPAVASKGWTAQNYQESIQILRGQLSETQMIKLHADHDIYVSPSRGEGIDLPSYKAKLAGKRIVATYSGGPEDFLGTKDIRVPESGFAKPHPVYGWEPDSEYGNYEIDDLAVALQKAADGPLVLKERDWPIDNFRARAIAPKLRRLVEKFIEEAR
jgi:glycosyltransferase involved in cell wall biosynthesis